MIKTLQTIIAGIDAADKVLKWIAIGGVLFICYSVWTFSPWGKAKQIVADVSDTTIRVVDEKKEVLSKQFEDKKHYLDGAFEKKDDLKDKFNKWRE